MNLFWIPADDSGPATRLTTSDVAQIPASWTPDGRTLVFHQCASQCDIWALSMDGERTKVWPVLQTPAQEWHATLSPDGKWLAYMSNESGRPEVYVQPFPGPGARHQISTEGGWFPLCLAIINPAEDCWPSGSFSPDYTRWLRCS